MEATKEIKRIKIKQINLKPNEDVYDLTIEDNHNFFGDNILVHNCAEANLADKEPCDLAEIFLNNIANQEEFIRCALLLYKTQKAALTLPALYPETEKIVKKNMRIGLGVTGVVQALDKVEWLDPTYRALKQFDIEWSKKRGWNKSIKLTVVKPSGTLSLLGGSTPGVHPGYSPYYIRRVRMSTKDPLVTACIAAGYKTESLYNFDGTENHETVIVEFICKFDDNTIVAKDMSAIKQLELVKKIQTVWADQSVSVTVYYKKEELPEIKAWLKENYEKNVKTVSFLLHQDHGFKQAPYEEISKEVYEDRIKNLKEIVINTSTVSDSLLDIECESGACPIR